ncbi:V-type ATPase 116kDa subunit family protein [Nocardia terpenica]|nr:V-type ATPase 116kDa subunit family protein [Nocardia terpenica]
MSWSQSLTPVRMQRVALIAPESALRAMLARVAATGVVQLDQGEGAEHSGSAVTPRISMVELDGAVPERDGCADLMEGERQVRARAEGAVRRRGVAAIAGWCPEPEVAGLRQRLESVGAAVVPLPVPAGIDPPTLLAGGAPLRRAFAPLVGLYGTMPYRDVDPTVPAGLAYVAMFGMMFGDVGHGLLLLAAAEVLRRGWIAKLARLRRLWVFVAGAGAAAIVFGLLYGEFFGPTGVLPVLWLSPLGDPVRLLIAAVAVGAGMLACAYGFGVVNRWREGGLPLALYASSGIAGAAAFLGVGVITAGILARLPAVVIAGAVVAGAGLILSVIGMFGESGGGAAGFARSGVGVIDLVVHLGANAVSFARLAAFGMTHAALGWVVWQATTSAASLPVVGIIVAAVVFVLGNAVAFALEALVAGVQALRLEFYELFSKIFAGAGEAFSPWRIPIQETEGASC